jgi:hypothetical protein
LDDTSENTELVSGLFFESEVDADLRTVIKRWDSLSVDVRLAIVIPIPIENPCLHILYVFLE